MCDVLYVILAAACVHGCVYVCMCVCVYGMYVCVSEVCMCVYVCVYVYVCIYVCVYVSVTLHAAHSKSIAPIDSEHREREKADINKHVKNTNDKITNIRNDHFVSSKKNSKRRKVYYLKEKSPKIGAVRVRKCELLALKTRNFDKCCENSLLFCVALRKMQKCMNLPMINSKKNGTVSVKNVWKT